MYFARTSFEFSLKLIKMKNDSTSINLSKMCKNLSEFGIYNESWECVTYDSVFNKMINFCKVCHCHICNYF